MIEGACVWLVASSSTVPIACPKSARQKFHRHERFPQKIPDRLQLQRAGKLLLMDRNTRFVLAFRAWNIVAGAGIVIFVPLYLSPQSQGYYFVFLSIVALQALFDLGLSQTLTQVTSHEFAHIDPLRHGGDVSGLRVGKLSYIKVAMASWYWRIGGAFVALVAIGGAVYFSLFGSNDETFWLGPWVALVVSTGLNMVLSPRLAIVEGAGWTGAAAKLRLIQSILGHSCLIACLIAGGELWSIVAVPAVATVCSFFWLRWTCNPYRMIPAYVDGSHNHVPWRSEILGLQWRVALAWLGGYFASQILVPVAFVLQGPEEAGRIGLGLQIFSAIQVLGMSWISARIPLFGQLISHANWPVLKTDFKKAAVSATVMSAAFALVVAVIFESARLMDLWLGARGPSAFAVIALAIVSTLGTAIYAMAAYMRAHKEEPLVTSSLVIGAATLAGAVLGGYINTDAIVAAYAAVTIFVNLPWTVLIFRRYYRRDRCNVGYNAK